PARNLISRAQFFKRNKRLWEQPARLFLFLLAQRSRSSFLLLLRLLLFLLRLLALTLRLRLKFLDVAQIRDLDLMRIQNSPPLHLIHPITRLLITRSTISFLLRALLSLLFHSSSRGSFFTPRAEEVQLR